MGVFDVCNFAYGDFVMVAAFAAYLVITKWSLPYVLAPIVAMVFCSVLGLAFEKGIFYPMRNRGGLEPGLATFGASSALETIALLIFGGNPLGVRALISGDVKVGSLFFPLQNLPIIIGSLFMISLLFLFVQRTKLGLAVRALQQDQEAATLQGISIANIRIVVWVISGCLVGAAGVLLAPISYVDPFIGSGLLLKGFAVVIMGGMGSIPGALVCGFLLGFVDSFGQTYLGTYSYLFAFGFIMIVLLIRPQGLLGKGR
jgi:branched-chain amino acid transport system permease protein